MSNKNIQERSDQNLMVLEKRRERGRREIRIFDFLGDVIIE